MITASAPAPSRAADARGFRMKTAAFMKIICLLLLSLGVLGSAAGQRRPTPTSSVPSPEPILRIEAGMHTSPIEAMDSDLQSRYLVTAAGDKTIRVWDLAT